MKQKSIINEGRYLVLYLVCIITLISFYVYIKEAVNNYISTGGVGIQAYLSLLMLPISVVLVFVCYFNKRIPNIILRLVFFGIYCFFVTVLHKEYLIREYPLLLINVFYWISIFCICYSVNKNIDKIQKLNTIITIASILYALIFIFNLEKSKTDFNWTFVNYCYYSLMAIPFVLTIKNKIFKFTAVSSILLACLYSQKRTAIIAIIAALFLYFFFSKKNIKTVTPKIIILFVITFFTVYFYNDIVNFLGIDVLRRFALIESDAGSGRLKIWKYVGDIISQMSIITFLFGSGYNALIEVFNKGISAHNDFIEIFLDYGLIGLIFYVNFIWYIIKSIWFSFKINSKYKVQFLISFVLFFIMSLTSHMIIYPTYFIFLVMFWSFVISQIKNIRKGEVKLNTQQ
jgi:hypothetical protein